MMSGHSNRRGEPVDAISGEFELRVEMASLGYRQRLQEKAAAMRAAVRDGETADERVLAVAEILNRLAEDEM